MPGELRQTVYQRSTAFALLCLQKTSKGYRDDAFLREVIKAALKQKTVVKHNNISFIRFADGTVFYVKAGEDNFKQLSGLSEPIEKIICGPEIDNRFTGSIVTTAFIGSSRIYFLSFIVYEPVANLYIQSFSSLRFLRNKTFDLTIAENQCYFSFENSVYSSGYNVP